MKRQQDRDSPPNTKLPRSAMSRFEESPRDRLTPDRDRRESRGTKSSPSHRSSSSGFARSHSGGGGGGGGGRSRGGDDRGGLDRTHNSGDFIRNRSFDSKSMAYKVLCVSNIHHKVNDALVKDVLSREFKKFGDVSVKVVHDGNERVAYLYFRNSDDAREARHQRNRAVLFDKPVNVDPVYTSDSEIRNSGSSRGRKSYSPDDSLNPYPSRPRGVSPAPSNTSSSGHRVRHNSLDRGGGVLNAHLRDIPFRRDGGGAQGAGLTTQHHHEFHQHHNLHREEKKEKFPNYLLHIPPEEDDKATRTLFVGNLEVNIQESELRRIFERYGVVEDIDVKRPPPGQGNAYAFIKFLNLDMAHRAKVEMSGQYIGKFQCKIGYGKATPTTRIWVGGLGPWTSLSHLEREFDRFGAIKKIDFVKGDNHAYILYDSIDAAQAACQEMRGFPLGGPDRRLRVDFADTTPYSYRQPSPRTNFREEGSVTPAAASDRYVPRGRFDPPDPMTARNDYYATSQEPDYNHWHNSSGYVSQQYDPYYDRGSRNQPRNDWSGYGGSDRTDRHGNSDYRWTRDRATWREDGSNSTPATVAATTSANRDWATDRRNKRPRSPDAPRDLGRVDRTKDGGVGPAFKQARLAELGSGDRTLTGRGGGRRSPTSPFHDPLGLVAGHRDGRVASPAIVQKDRRFTYERPPGNNNNNSAGDADLGKSIHRNRTTDDFREDRNNRNEGNGVVAGGSESRNGFGSTTATTNSPANGATSLQELSRAFSVTWQGCLVLKNSAFPARMHCCQGDSVLVDTMMKDVSGEAPMLRITQRLRMDQPKLDDVSKRIVNSGHSGHCILVGFPGTQSQPAEELANPIQQRPLRNLVTYLKQKEAAGVIALPVNKAGAGGGDPAKESNGGGVLYAFPPCPFSCELLTRVAPNLTEEGLKEDYLVVVVVKAIFEDVMCSGSNVVVRFGLRFRRKFFTLRNSVLIFLDLNLLRANDKSYEIKSTTSCCLSGKISAADRFVTEVCVGVEPAAG